MTRGRWDRKGCALMGRAGKTSQQDGTEVSQKDTKEHSTCRPAVEHSRSGSGCSRSPMEVTAGELTEQERAGGQGRGWLWRHRKRPAHVGHRRASSRLQLLIPRRWEVV